MISNERPSPYGARYGAPPPRPHVPEDTIQAERLQIERKTFVLALKENQRGRFLRITEDVGGRRDTIIVPATGLEDFRRLINAMADAALALGPAPSNPPAPPVEEAPPPLPPL